MSAGTFQIKEHILPCQHIREYARATAVAQEDVLKLAIKQYIPLDNLSPRPGDVTIIGAHANGFPKELYEPLWEDIHNRSKTDGFRIRSIWIADIAHQGTSGALNEYLLGNDPSWFDHPRDLLHMINTFRAEMPMPIIGIGHSLGGCQLAKLSLIHPRLLSTLVLLDPVIQGHKPKSLPKSSPTVGETTGIFPAKSSTFRRDLWPSRSEAVATFKKSRFYQSWDPRVLDRWLEYGIRETPTAIFPDERDGAVTLRTSKHQEVWSFLRPIFNLKGHSLEVHERYPDRDPEMSTSFPFYRPEPPWTFANLPYLRPSTLYIFGGDSEMSTPELRKEKLEATGTGIGGSGGIGDGRVKEVVLEGIGHLVPMEAVSQCAEAASSWVSVELQRWSKEAEAYKAWTQLSTKEKTTVANDWIEQMGGNQRKLSKSKI